MFKWLGTIVVVAIVATTVVFISTGNQLLQGIAGAILGLSVVALMLTTTFIALAFLSLLFKETLTHDPNNEKWYQFWVLAKRNWTVTINQGGRPLYVVRGTQNKATQFHKLPLWNWYERLVYYVHGRHPFLPYITQPTTYSLPLRETHGERGKIIFNDVPNNRSNNVRTTSTDWPFMASGVYVGTVRFAVKMLVTYRIRSGDAYDVQDDGMDGEVIINEITGEPIQWEMQALYRAASWNVMLDTAVASSTRAVLASNQVTLDMVIDSVSESLWPDRDHGVSGKEEETAYGRVSQSISRHLEEWRGKKGSDSKHSLSLAALGIVVERADVLSFEPELDEKGEAKLSEAAFALQEARGDSLKGKAAAEALEAIKDVFGKEFAETILNAEALKSAASESEIITALLTRFTQQLGISAQPKKEDI